MSETTYKKISSGLYEKTDKFESVGEVKLTDLDHLW